MAADICRVLGLSTASGTFMHLKKLDDSEKVKLTPNQIWGKGSGAGIVAITESGLYKLVMRSDKPDPAPTVSTT